MEAYRDSGHALDCLEGHEEFYVMKSLVVTKSMKLLRDCAAVVVTVYGYTKLDKIS